MTRVGETGRGNLTTVDVTTLRRVGDGDWQEVARQAGHADDWDGFTDDFRDAIWPAFDLEARAGNDPHPGGAARVHAGVVARCALDWNLPLWPYQQKIIDYMMAARVCVAYRYDGLYSDDLVFTQIVTLGDTACLARIGADQMVRQDALAVWLDGDVTNLVVAQVHDIHGMHGIYQLLADTPRFYESDAGILTAVWNLRVWRYLAETGRWHQVTTMDQTAQADREQAEADRRVTPGRVVEAMPDVQPMGKSYGLNRELYLNTPSVSSAELGLGTADTGETED